jgi:hypothetical protein
MRRTASLTPEQGSHILGSVVVVVFGSFFFWTFGSVVVGWGWGLVEVMFHFLCGCVEKQVLVVIVVDKNTHLAGVPVSCM